MKQHAFGWLNQSHNDETLLIKDLIKEHGKTCITIIIPTHRYAEGRQQDMKDLRQAILSASELVSRMPDDLSKTLDDLLQQIDYKNNKEGIGIFISPHIRRVMQFPFPVTRKIIVGPYFNLLDLLYIQNYKTGYYLLDISKKEIHLFQGRMDYLEEIRDSHFPMKLEDDFEYAKPAPGTSNAGYAHTKSFEKDKSESRKLRIKKSFSQADNALVNYPGYGKLPLILYGLNENVSMYKSVMGHSGKMVLPMRGNYQNADLRELGVIAWTTLRTYLDEAKQELIEELKEKVGIGKAVYGLEDVWKSAREGKGFRLLVEKDYSHDAYLTGDKQIFASQTGSDDQYDVVNEIISAVLEKNGDVVIFEKGLLEHFNKIALINRY